MRVGNDIVDTTKAGLQNRRKQRFYDKVFTTEEQDMLHCSSQAANLVWEFWSMKESAYKVHVKMGVHQRFNPLRYACRQIDRFKAEVQIEKQTFPCTIQRQAGYVHCCISRVENKAYSGVIKYASPKESTGNSQRLYQALFKAVEQRYGFDSQVLTIRKNRQQVPQLYCKNELLAIDISLSHHGDYGAYLFS